MPDFYAIIIFLFDFTEFIFKCLAVYVQSLFRLVIKPSKKSLRDEIVLVTGAAQGLGRELASEFGQKGAQLVLWDINEERLQQTEKELRDLKYKVVSYICDVTDRNAIHETAKKVCNDVGDVTILVNNAGIVWVQLFSTFKEEKLRKLMDVNVMSHYWMLKEFLPKMVEMNHGHIVAISSTAGFLPSPYFMPYSCTKFAVRGMMESLSLEYMKNADLHFTTVFPFFLNTPMLHNVKDETERDWSYFVTNPKSAAEQIVNGVQRNYDRVFIPRLTYLLYLINNCMPRKIIFLVYDFMKVRVSPPED